MNISKELGFTPGGFTAAVLRKLGLPTPQLLSAVGAQLSNNANSARKLGDAFGHAYTMVTEAKGDHVRTFNGTIMAFFMNR